MNCTCYLFGRFNGKYTQYPQDETQVILETGVRYCSKESELIIHREGNMMYYSLVRPLSNRIPSYIGICVCLNNLMLTDIEDIYALLDNELSTMAISGRIIDFGRNGLTSVVKRLNGMSVECDEIFKNIRTAMDRMDGKLSKLPPIRYGVSHDTYYICSLEDNNDNIVEGALKYGYMLAFKSEAKDGEWTEVETILELDKEKTPAEHVQYRISRKDILIAVMGIIILILLLIIII